MPIRKQDVEKREFKYSSMQECEANEEAHEFHPTVWPPRPYARNSNEMPSVSGRCVFCNCNLTVYEGHALPEGEPGHIPQIKVVLPTPKRKSA